jgi:yecA family protein
MVSPPDHSNVGSRKGFRMPQLMMLSDLDGFLTGIAVGPELVLPSEWLPLDWGSDAPEFADEGEAKAVLGAILGRYNEILRQIDHEFSPDAYFYSA